MSNTSHFIGEIMNRNKENITFNQSWVLWSHESCDEDYSLKSYKICWETSDIQDFLQKMEQLTEEAWSQKMYFFMRKGITPRYEDPKNLNGSSWSFRVNKNYCYTSWFSLCIQCLGECLFELWNEMKNVNGISLSPKNNTTTIRIWLSSKSMSPQNQQLKLQYAVPNIDPNKAMYRNT